MCASNLLEGFTAVCDHSLHLVLLDIQLADEDGLLFTKWMRVEPENYRIPVIAVTAQAMPADRERILEARYGRNINTSCSMSLTFSEGQV